MSQVREVTMPEQQSAIIEWVDPHLLKPHQASLQIYGEDDYRDLVESIRGLGVLQPLYATPEGVIISGYRRWQAAKAAEKQVPVIRKKYPSKLDEKRAIIELNRYRIKSGQQLYNEGMALKEIETKRAEQERRRKISQYRSSETKENFPSSKSETQTRDNIAQTIGLGSGKQWDKLKFVAVNSPDLLTKIKPDGITIHKAYTDTRQAIKKQERQTKRERAAQDGAGLVPPEGTSVECGDFRKLGENIPSDSIDLVFTDPSYGEDYLDLWEPLAELAARALKPGRFLLTYCGKLYLPIILTRLGQHLQYYWIAGKYYDQGHSFFRSRKIWDQWRPMLIYQKPGPAEHEWFLDMIRMGSRGQAKELHDYGQSLEDARYYIQKLTVPGEIVLDVCCGSGTILLAAKESDRRVKGFDVDESLTGIAKSRLAEVVNQTTKVS